MFFSTFGCFQIKPELMTMLSRIFLKLYFKTKQIFKLIKITEVTCSMLKNPKEILVNFGQFTLTCPGPCFPFVN